MTQIIYFGCDIIVKVALFIALSTFYSDHRINETFMKLYYAPGTCALACWVALEWTKADYEAVRADSSSEEYKRINPLAAVPALDIGGKRAMTQASAILTYIADKHPEAELGSKGGAEEDFALNEIMSFLASDFHPAFLCHIVSQQMKVKPQSMRCVNLLMQESIVRCNI